MVESKASNDSGRLGLAGVCFSKVSSNLTGGSEFEVQVQKESFSGFRRGGSWFWGAGLAGAAQLESWMTFGKP